MENAFRRIKTVRIIRIIFLAAFLAAAECAAAEPEVRLTSGQTVYVPVYSHIYYGDAARTLNLTITLSIRNTDISRKIKVLSADYYDSNGKLVKKYLQNPLELGPLSSKYYLVRESDVTGGDAPNFLVRWKSDQKVNAPIIEGIMIGTISMQGISFVLPGQVIEE